MNKKWVVLDLINGEYSRMYSGEPALFTTLAFAEYDKQWLEEFYGTSNRFEILEVEAN